MVLNLNNITSGVMVIHPLKDTIGQTNINHM